MVYVFDTNSLQELFRYPTSRFPSLWRKFERVVEKNKLISVREVLKEIDAQGETALNVWAKENKHLFPEATPEEARPILDIFKNEHFQNAHRAD